MEDSVDEICLIPVFLALLAVSVSVCGGPGLALIEG